VALKRKRERFAWGVSQLVIKLKVYLKINNDASQIIKSIFFPWLKEKE
jgi:hypothetical protein